MTIKYNLLLSASFNPFKDISYYGYQMKLFYNIFFNFGAEQCQCILKVHIHYIDRISISYLSDQRNNPISEVTVWSMISLRV